MIQPTHQISLSALVTVAIKTAEMPQSHGLKGIYVLVLSKDFIAAADLLCKVVLAPELSRAEHQRVLRPDPASMAEGGGSEPAGTVSCHHGCGLRRPKKRGFGRHRHLADGGEHGGFDGDGQSHH